MSSGKPRDRTDHHGSGHEGDEDKRSERASLSQPVGNQMRLEDFLEIEPEDHG